MHKLIFSLLLLIGLKSTIFAQNIEKTILQYFYDNLKEQNEYLAIQKSMKGVYLSIDPLTGEKEIHFRKEIENRTIDSLSRFSREEQIKIFSAYDALLPLLKDTLIIVDTINFFSEGEVILNHEKRSVLRIVRSKPNKKCNNCAYLYATGIRKSILMIAFTNDENKYFYTYYFDLSLSKIVFQKTSIVKRETTFE